MSKKIEIEITPSPRARQLYQIMVNRADYERRGGQQLHLTLDSTLALACDRVNMLGTKDDEEIDQLQQEGWIKPHSEGGWILA